MKHIKKTYQKHRHDYILENIETTTTPRDPFYLMIRHDHTIFNGGFIITKYNGKKMTKNIFLT